MADRLQELPNDVLTRVLSLLPAPSLAALSCSSASLRLLSGDPATWRRLCLSTWPSLHHPLFLSLPFPPRSFFADVISSPSPDPSISAVHLLPTELISAVDLYHNGEPIFSRLIETDATCASFLDQPFRLDVIDSKTALNASSLDGLTLSWILIDPSRNRAVNLSSLTPVSIDRDLYTAEVLVRFAIVLINSMVMITISWSEKTGAITQLSLQLEDEEGDSVTGEGSLVILAGLMEGKRGKLRGEMEMEMERVKRYEEFVGRKRRGKEGVDVEVVMEFCFSVLGSVLVLLIMVFMVM